MNESFPQTIEPPHCLGLEARREHFAHQPVIMRIKRCHLNIMANMLQQVSFSIVAGKWWMIEMPQHFGTLYLAGERWSGCSPQHLAHGVQSCILMPASILMWSIMTTSHGFVGSISRPARTTIVRRFNNATPSIFRVIKWPFMIPLTTPTSKLYLQLFD